MLKINQIQILDKHNRMLCIDGKRVENFPLQGGEEANMISSKSWNQHGNTFVNAFMESFEGELDFIIPSYNKKPEGILCNREAITSVCNPLNGTVTLKVSLNSGDTFLRDITFVTAPIFPIGFENRNSAWQKVKLIYEANNPFWYSEKSIYESFQGVEPVFQFPFSNEVIIPNIIPSPTFEDLTKFNDWYSVMTFTTELNNSVLIATMTNYATNPRMRFVLGSTNRTNFIEGKEYIFSFKIKPDATLKELEYLDYVAYNSDGSYDWVKYGDKIILNTLEADQEGYYNLSFDIKADRTGEVRMGLGFGGFINLEMADGSAFRIKDLKIEPQFIEGYVEPTIVFGNVIPANKAINKGQVEAPVIIRIVGACVNPLIQNLTTGEFIGFKDLTMVTGDELIIDTTFGQKKVELNGQNVFNKLDFASTFFNLIRGANTIEFTDDSSSQEASIQFIYQKFICNFIEVKKWQSIHIFMIQ